MADVTGEDIKPDIVEGQQGIPFALDLQIINVQTCEPITDAYIELWSRGFHKFCCS